MEHSRGAIRTACDIEIDGMLGLDRLKKELKLTTFNPQEKHLRRTGLSAAIHASYLERGYNVGAVGPPA